MKMFIPKDMAKTRKKIHLTFFHEYSPKQINSFPNFFSKPFFYGNMIYVLTIFRYLAPKLIILQTKNEIILKWNFLTRISY